MIRRKTEFFMGGLAIGLAFGFVRYFDRLVYFPLFPNILDSLLMLTIGVYLIVNSIRHT